MFPSPHARFTRKEQNLNICFSRPQRNIKGIGMIFCGCDAGGINITAKITYACVAQHVFGNFNYKRLSLTHHHRIRPTRIYS